MRSFLALSLTASFLIAPSLSSADVAKGKELFSQRCATCHGAEGAGDGPVAQGLPAEMKPRNLQEFKVKYATDDAKFLELLKKGGAAVGLNPLMPQQPDLKDEELKSIIQFVHSLKK